MLEFNNNKMNKILIALVTLSLVIAPAFSQGQVMRCASELGIEGLCFKIVRNGSEVIEYVDG